MFCVEKEVRNKIINICCADSALNPMSMDGSVDSRLIAVVMVRMWVSTHVVQV
jgi:hypothetical protein